MAAKKKTKTSLDTGSGVDGIIWINGLGFRRSALADIVENGADSMRIDQAVGAVMAVGSEPGRPCVEGKEPSRIEAAAALPVKTSVASEHGVLLYPRVDGGILQIASGSSRYEMPSLSHWDSFEADLFNDVPMQSKVLGAFKNEKGQRIKNLQRVNEAISLIGKIPDATRWLFFWMTTSEEGQKLFTVDMVEDSLKNPAGGAAIRKAFAEAGLMKMTTHYASPIATALSRHNTLSLLVSAQQIILKKELVVPALTAILANFAEAKRVAFADIFDKAPAATQRELITTLFTKAAKSPEAGAFVLWNFDNGHVGSAMISTWLRGQNQNFWEWATRVVIGACVTDNYGNIVKGLLREPA
jgi:hypothetical protein